MSASSSAVTDIEPDNDAVGESIYDQKPPNPKKIDTEGFLTDSGRICRIK